MEIISSYIQFSKWLQFSYLLGKNLKFITANILRKIQLINQLNILNEITQRNTVIKIIIKHPIKRKEIQEIKFSYLVFSMEKMYHSRSCCFFKVFNDSSNSIQEVKSMNDEILGLKWIL